MNVNAYDAKSVGISILKSLEGKSIADTTLQRKFQVVSMASKSGVKVGDDVIHIDQQLLFQRLTVTERPPRCFQIRAVTYPPALFDSNGMMLPSNKSTLADGLWSEYMASTSTILPIRPHYVLDGGALLHRISWPKSVTYYEVIDMYCSYVIEKYGSCSVVFDGYVGSPSTKDPAHIKRKGAKNHPNVVFNLEMIVPSSKDVIFHNASNKQRFITFLGNELEKRGCNVHHSNADADTLIVTTTLKSAETKPTVLVGDDTDLLVLLLAHVDTCHEPVFFAPEPKKRQKKQSRIWDIHFLKHKLGNVLCRRLLFVHAISGCDTTSRLFGLAK